VGAQVALDRGRVVNELLDAIAKVLDSADDTGCTPDLTVVDAQAIEGLQTAFDNRNMAVEDAIDAFHGCKDI
jgi:hypothetical protein